MEQINSRIFEKHPDFTCNEVLALSKRAYEALSKQVETMAEEDLTIEDLYIYRDFTRPPLML